MYRLLGFIHVQTRAFSLSDKVCTCTGMPRILPTGGVSTFIDSGHRQYDFPTPAQRRDHTEAPKPEAVDSRCRRPVSPEDGLPAPIRQHEFGQSARKGAFLRRSPSVLFDNQFHGLISLLRLFIMMSVTDHTSCSPYCSCSCLAPRSSGCKVNRVHNKMLIRGRKALYTFSGEPDVLGEERSDGTEV